MKSIMAGCISPGLVATGVLDPSFGLHRSHPYYRLCVQSGWQHFAMENTATLKQDIKRLMVENLMLQSKAEEIADDLPLFGPGSLGLDSVDALQLVVALDKNYGLKIPDPEAAKKVLQSVNTIVAALEQRLSGQPH
jgi:acyl carrier protein